MTLINPSQVGPNKVFLKGFSARLALLASACFLQFEIVGCSSSQQHRTLSKETLGMDTVVVWDPIVFIKKKSLFSAQTDTASNQSAKDAISKTIAKVLTKKTDKTILVDFPQYTQEANANSIQEINPILVANLMRKLKSGDCKRTCSEVAEITSAYPSDKVLVFSLWKGVFKPYLPG